MTWYPFGLCHNMKCQDVSWHFLCLTPIKSMENEECDTCPWLKNRRSIGGFSREESTYFFPRRGLDSGQTSRQLLDGVWEKQPLVRHHLTLCSQLSRLIVPIANTPVSSFSGPCKEGVHSIHSQCKEAPNCFYLNIYILYLFFLSKFISIQFNLHMQIIFFFFFL